MTFSQTPENTQEENINPFEALANHIGLPAQLPGCQENNLVEIEDHLTNRLLDAAKFILDIQEVPFKDIWRSLYRSLVSTRSVIVDGVLSKSCIISALQNLTEDDFILLYVTEQNAGIYVTLQNNTDGERKIIFEVSEASPKVESVLESPNALKWEFPSTAVSLPLSVYNDYNFKEELATFLSEASIESVKDVAAHIMKANSETYESRETVDPVIITGLLTTILKSRGEQFFAPLLKKRVRDDVCWDSTGENPWRRSPLWLMLRVAIERYLRARVGSDFGHMYYKLLMCLFHCQYLSEYTTYQYAKVDVLQHLLQKLVVRIDKIIGKEAALTGTNASQFRRVREILEESFEMSVESAAKKLSVSRRTLLMAYVAETLN